ncbi:MAG: cellulose binding domain-containing protein [Clostridiales bacterium]|nr:cellulose binding domain-containing protein [Clostridiales bacterium]
MSIVLSMMTQMGASVVFAKENDAAFLSCSDDLVYEVTENRQSLWDGHMVVEYTVKNSGNKEINDWNFLVNIPYDIESIWNAQKLESDGAYYQIGNYGWNSTIQPGQSITFGMTLSGIQDTSNIESPTTWLLNSARKALASDNLSVTYTEYSNWGSGFNGVLKITNNANTAINDWSFDITTNRPITSVSNAVFKDNGNNSYTLSNAGYNAKINAHSSIEISINGGSNDKSSFAVSIVNATESAAAFSLKGDNDKNGVPDYQEYIQGKLPDIPVVSPTPTSTPVPTATSTPVPTSTPTSTPVPTATSTPVPTSTPTSTPVPTATSTPVPTMTPTDTPAPTATSTPVPTMTPTDTPAPTATSTPVPTMTPTGTPAPTATSTPVPTMTPTDTPAPTATSTPVPTMTPTGTPTPTVTSTPTPTPAVISVDSDKDGLSDEDELIWGTDPSNPDTDGDTILDGDEVRMGKNPLDPSDKDLKVEQTLTIDISNDEDQAVTSISVTMNLARPIDRVLTIKDVYQTDWYTRDLYSRLGSPISFECAEEFDTAKVVFHYADGFLDDTNEDDLGVLWYDEENCCYIEQEQAVVDKEANTVSMEVTHFSTYAMHDKLKWKKLKIPGTKHCFYAHVEDTYSVVKGQPLDMDAAEKWVYFWYSLTISGDVKKVVRLSRKAEFKEYWGYEEVYLITCDWIIFTEYDEDENDVYDFLEDGSEHMATNGHVYTNSDPFEHVFVTKSNGTIYVTKGLPASTVSYTGDIPDDSPDKWLKTFIEKLAEDITYVFRRLKNGDPLMSTDKYYGIEDKNVGGGLDREYTFYYCDKNGRYDLYTAGDMLTLADHLTKHWGYEDIYDQYLRYTRDELYFDLSKTDSYDFDGDGIPDYKDTDITHPNGNAVRYCVYNEAGFSSTFKVYVNYIDDANLVAQLDGFDAYDEFKTGEYKELFASSAQQTEVNFNVTYISINSTIAENLDGDHDGFPDYADLDPDSFDTDGDGIPDADDEYKNLTNGGFVRYYIQHDSNSNEYSIYVNYIDDTNLVATKNASDFSTFKSGEYSALFGSDVQYKTTTDDETRIIIKQSKAESLDYDHDGLPDYLDPKIAENNTEDKNDGRFRKYRTGSALTTPINNADVLFVCDLPDASYNEHSQLASQLRTSGITAYAVHNLTIYDYMQILDEPQVCVFSMHGMGNTDGSLLATNIYVDKCTDWDFIEKHNNKGIILFTPLGNDRVYRLVLTKDFFVEYYGLQNTHGNNDWSNTVILSESCSFFGKDGSVKDTLLSETLHKQCGSPFLMGFQCSVSRDYAFDYVKNMINKYYNETSDWTQAYYQTGYKLGFSNDETEDGKKWISYAWCYPDN